MEPWLGARDQGSKGRGDGNDRFLSPSLRVRQAGPAAAGRPRPSRVASLLLQKDEDLQETPRTGRRLVACCCENRK